jgi:hypothetical protein
MFMVAMPPLQPKKPRKSIFDYVSIAQVEIEMVGSLGEDL